MRRNIDAARQPPGAKERPAQPKRIAVSHHGFTSFSPPINANLRPLNRGC